MKYTKLFNNHSEYVAYTGGTSFITPNVSWCIQEQEAHCTPLTPVQNPVINCTENVVTITCATAGADLLYRLDESGNYSAYTDPIEITADTIVEAYAELNGKRSAIVSEECEYNPPTHDYSKDYLTLSILTGGTIMWVARNNVAKTISYSTNSGESWTEITASSTGTPINVSAGDKVLLKGSNEQYATGKDAGSGFSGGTAYYNVEGNVMSLIGGDSFTGLTSFNNKSWVFHNLFAQSKAVSAENLILPVMTLTSCCYRGMFSKANSLKTAPELPATTLAASAYTYMFDVTQITTAPELPAATVPTFCYRGMFENCYNLNYIKCLATTLSTNTSTSGWTLNVASTGTFVKDKNMTSWTTGNNGIPTNWVVRDDGAIVEPTISFDGYDTITITCETSGADIYYRLNQSGSYSVYTTAITITADTTVEAYSEKDGDTSTTVSQSCTYVAFDPFEYSNRSLDSWTYVNDSINVEVPYSVNAIDGHSSHYKTDGDNPKIPFSFETSVSLREAQPTYLWLEHADQSADIYVDNELVETHWGGYNAFFSDITDHIHAGTNNIKVSLRNKTRSELAPCAGDFNFNATLGYVKLFTSSYLPDKEYGYDGFHITSTVSSAEAAINIKTKIPTGASVVCKIDSGSTNVYSATSASTNAEMTFTTTIQNPHLWNGTADPFMYTVTLEVYHDGDLYHRYVRPYGFRYYEYVINDTVKYGTAGNPYTGFLLNGSPYLLRGVCIHSDKDGKANALTSADIASDFNIIEELGCNFIRLAHYPHPKAVYDTCDRLGIVVQTEVPWINQSSSGQPEAYYTHLTGQYDDMVKQHYNHPCIFFWGLANEITPSTTAFTKDKIEQYTAQIKTLDSERMVGFVMPMGNNSPANFGTPNVDWFGYNIYEGWYQNQNSNNPTSALNTRVNNTINNAGKPLAYSEYGCGGTPTCHSDDFMTTTTRGNNPRHDIEYMMWLHEGHIAAIKNFQQLMFTSQWQLFDIAVSNRQEGYKVCLDGETVTDNNDLKYLNDKGLVERDHVTKKDTFYLYKAWWNQTDKFVHICGKNYQKVENRVIKCYTNDGNSLTLYVNGTSAETVTVTNNIATFTARNFNNNDTVMVSGATTSDTFSIKSPEFFCKLTLSDSTIVKIEGNGALTSAHTDSYKTEIISVELGSLCTRISEHALDNCSAMTSIDISDSVTSIGEYAFNGCKGLTGITIPNSVTSIGSCAFQICSALTSVNIPSSITVINGATFINCYSLSSITIPDSVTGISWNAFSSCRSLTSITIPNSVTSIDSEAFGYCTGLTSVTIGSGVTSIGASAFTWCTSLTSIDIPSGVTRIGNSTFYRCSGLTSVTVNATTPPGLGEYAFGNNASGRKIYVPSASVNTYKAATNWSTYANDIEAIP